MKFLNFVKIALCLAVISLFACQKEDSAVSNVSSSEQNSENATGQIVLGKKLENPYDLAVMQKAYDNLSDNSNREKLSETHLYIKFMPQDEKELTILELDSTLILYSYPLDYEIKTKGSSYQDPEVPMGKPTYQYCAVEVGKELPKGIKYTVLAKLFIPNETNVNNTRSSAAEFAHSLEVEAFRLSNNSVKIESSNKNNTAESRTIGILDPYTPRGRITVFDNSKAAYIAVEGAEVRARTWFTTYIGTTNSDGYFTCNGSFILEPTYSINWEKYDFGIRDGQSSIATYLGPTQKMDWNLQISGNQSFYVTAFRAAYRYYYKDIFGCRRPPFQNQYGHKIHMRVYLTADPDDYYGWFATPENHWWNNTNLIEVWNKKGTQSSMYSNVIHEIAHASHWKMDPISYTTPETTTSLRLGESYAMGMDIQITTSEYPDFSLDYYQDNIYTNVVRDMIDGVAGYDKVSGYTLRQIEDALIGTITFQQWKNNIKNNYNNPTENKLDALFTYWENYVKP
jgi:hypothetical protein